MYVRTNLHTLTHARMCPNSDQVRSQFEKDPAFEAFTEEVERVRVFKEFVKTIKVCLVCCMYMVLSESCMNTRMEYHICSFNWGCIVHSNQGVVLQY